MKFVEEQTIGPTLGQENITKGLNSVIIGFILVFIFMLIRYRLFGIAANFALIFNLVLITAVMSIIGATLTLPGIAGIVLTVGMAVDANVLIFERIKEEIKKEKVIPVSQDKSDDLLGLKLKSVENLPKERIDQIQVETGVYVEEVLDGPAKEAGIQIGDVITNMAFQEVSNLEDYNSILAEFDYGANLAVRIVRKGNGSFITL